MEITQSGYYVFNVPHTYVFRQWISLTAGTQYVFDTRNLNGRRPDPVMYLVIGNTIVAYNDDYMGLNSLIAYVPPVSGQYLLVIRALNANSLGTCDVYQKTGNSAPVPIANQTRFGGTPFLAKWKADETIETKNATGDTYLYIIEGSKMFYNDDGGSDLLCSRIRPGYSGEGIVIVGSWISESEGITQLCNFYKSYFIQDYCIKLPFIPPHLQGEFVITDRVLRFQNELQKIKPELELLSSREVEKRVKQLKAAYLNSSEILLMKAPKFNIPKQYDTAYNKYIKLLKSKEKSFKNLSMVARANEMEKLQIDKKEIFSKMVIG